MAAYRENRVSEIKEEIARGAYSVDPKAVADAIIRRLRQQPLLAGTPTSPGYRPAGGAADGRVQASSECS